VYTSELRSGVSTRLSTTTSDFLAESTRARVFAFQTEIWPNMSLVATKSLSRASVRVATSNGERGDVIVLTSAPLVALWQRMTPPPSPMMTSLPERLNVIARLCEQAVCTE